MSSPKTQNNNPYPNAEEVLRQISGLIQGEECIFRGEPEKYKYPCSSTLYRQLKKENATKGSIPRLLKQRQNRLIERISRHKDQGDNDLDRLMAYQHNGGKTNLLDFTRNKLVALFFACFGNDDKNGQIIVKQRGTFPKVTDELPDNRVVLLEPPKDLPRAKDQSGVFISPPSGSLPVVEEETVVIRAEWKQEILDHLKNECDISYETLFDDMQGIIEQEKREDEKRVSETSQSTTNLQGFARPKDNHNILIMESYMRLLMASAEGLYGELLNNQANVLIKNFTDAIKSNPRDAEAYFNRALVYHSKPDPDYDKAIADYTRALELDTRLEGAYNNRGNAYAERPKPDYDLALSDYNSAIKQSSDLAVAYNNRGNVYKNKLNPDYELAIADYDHSLKLNPNYAEAYYNRGNAYSDKPEPDYDKAILDYDKAIKLNPGYADAYNNRGNAYAKKPNPDYDKAILDYTGVLKLKPNRAKAYNNRGNVYMKKPNPDYVQALLDYNQALQLDPDYEEAYSNRGSAHMNKPEPDYDKAILDYDRALSLSPDMAAVYHNRGAAYMLKPDPDYGKADTDFSRALDLNPRLTQTYCLRSLAHIELGDYVRARRDYDMALKIEPAIAENPEAMAIRKWLEFHNREN